MLSVFGMRWFTQALSVNPPPFWITFELDYRVMLFVTALIVLASLFAGALPGAARRARQRRRRAQGRQPFVDERQPGPIQQRARSSASSRVSCGLLIAAGLMIKSVVQLKNVQMPFAIENVLTARVDLPRRPTPTRRRASGSSSSSCRRLRRCRVSRRRRCRTDCRRPATARSRCRSKASRTRSASDYPLAREGIVTAGYFETFQTPAC